MSSKFSSAFVVTLLLSHTVLAPLTAVAQEQDASPQQVQKTTDSNSNESAEAAQRAVADPIDNWMPDKALQAAVAKALGLEVSKITKSDMLQLTYLYGSGVGIASLEGLQYASNLSFLQLNHNQITDLTPLQQLSKLSNLRLEDNQITDFTPLRDLSNLKQLNLNGNHVSDLTLLRDLSNLSALSLDDNQITDLTPLRDLSNLSFLYLNGNQITDITPLQQLSNLLILELGSNHISDLTPLQNLNLSKLYAENQTITLPSIYVLNKQPYSLSVQTAIKNLNGTTPTISPQNNDTWTGIYNSGKVEWSSANQVPETGDLVLTWTDQNTNEFSGKYVQPYVLSKASITAHNSTIYVGDNWQARDNFDSALDHDGNLLDFSKITVAGTVDTGRPGVYSIVYSYDGLEEKVEVTVEEKPSNSEPSKGEVTPEEKPSAPEASKGEVTPEGKPSTPEPSKGEVQSKKEKASKKLPATGEKDTKIFSAIGLGILAILGTYISRKN